MTTAVNMVDLVSQFRMMVYEHAPYLAPYVYSLTPVERRGLGTMAVDKAGKLYYDPVFCESLTLDQGGYVALHEGWHIVLRHCHRAEGIVGPNPSKQTALNLNIAMDIVVWELMVAIAHLAPPGGVTLLDAQKRWPDIKPNMTVEALFAIIEQGEAASDDPAQPEKEGKPDGSNEPSEEGMGTGEDQSGGESPAKDTQPGSGDSEDAADNHGFKLIGGGSAADGQPREYEETADPNWDAFVEDGLLEQVERKIEEIESGGGRGNVPAALKEVIKSKLRPQPNPWDKLRATVAKAIANHRGAPDYTYKRPNRRQQDLAIRLKGQQKFSPKAVVIIDTSGSMTSECLAKALVVIKQGLKAIGKIPVITCDAKVQHDKVLTSIHDDFEFTGRGGTDMRVPIAYSEEKYKPDVTVLVTDTDTPWPNKKLHGQLIVAATREGDVPAWAIKVRIPDAPNKESVDA